MKYSSLALITFLLTLTLNVNAGIVINEMYYNPPDDHLKAGEFREFVELYNSDATKINLSGYYFDNGIRYTFTDGTWIEAGSYIVLAKSLSTNYWRNEPFRMVGPFEGFLSDGGERITLKRPDGSIVDSLKYDDSFPWSQAADGYYSSLERISWDLPSDDFHSWRSSFTAGGTPGASNSINDIAPYPLMTSYLFDPPHPTSSEVVRLQVTLDTPELIESVVCRYESFDTESSTKTLIPYHSSWRYWEGSSSPSNGMDWTEQTFDDSLWERGRGGFGYGDLDRLNTPLPTMRTHYSTVYLRQTLILDEVPPNGTILLQLYYDDGFICYINGKESAHANTPQTYTHSSVALGDHEANELSVYVLNSDHFQTGTNTIAIIGFNKSLNESSDFVLTPSLVHDQNTTSTMIPMQKVQQNDAFATFEAIIPKQASQTIVRNNLSVLLTTGQTVSLPHVIEPSPFLSYFVYDGEIESTLPILWLLPPMKSSLLNSSRAISAAVCLRPGETEPDLFDGALVIPSASNRKKVRFIKDAEFYGDRTINIIPEIPTGGTNAGVSSPYREHLGFWFFQKMGVLSPWSEFYRIVELPRSSETPQTQQLVNQQVNEKFLEMNGRDPNADLYKMVYSNPNLEKHTNKAEGTGSIEEMISALNTSDMQQRRTVMEKRLMLDQFLAYSVASVFVSNWDGFWNNNWLVLDPQTQMWEMIPWDLDWIWGATPPPNTGPMYWKMPLDFPIDGVADGDGRVSRPRGVVTSPMHQEPQFFKDYLSKLSTEFNRTFALDHLFNKMDEMESLLLADLEMIHQQTGRDVDRRRQQIQESYITLKLFVERRRDFLTPLLPAPVDEWTLY